MGVLAANVTMAGSVLLCGLAIVMLAIAIVSYARTHQPRLLWIAAAFLGIVVEGVYFVMQSFAQRGELGTLPALVALNLAIVAALYVAVLRP